MTIRTVVATHPNSTCTQSERIAHFRHGLASDQRVRSNTTSSTVSGASTDHNTSHVVEVSPQ